MPRPVVRARVSADTPESAVLQVLPVAPVLLSIMSPLFAGGWTFATVVGLAIPIGIVAIITAEKDRRRLSERRLPATTSSLLAGISPLLYLYLRFRRVRSAAPDAADPLFWCTVVTITALALTIVGVLLQATIDGFFASADSLM